MVSTCSASLVRFGVNFHRFFRARFGWCSWWARPRAFVQTLDAGKLAMDVQNQIVGIVGRKGSGKSTMLRTVMEGCPRLFVLDAMAEHSWIPNRFCDLGRVEEFLVWTRKQRTFAGAFIPREDFEEESCRLLDLIYDEGNLALGIEEVPMLCTASFQPPALDRIFRLGRHRRLDVVWTAQRMAETSRRITSCTDRFILFAHTEPRDLDAIADRCGRDVAERVAGLPLHGKLVWDAVPRGWDKDGNKGWDNHENLVLS